MTLDFRELDAVAARVKTGQEESLRDARRDRRGVRTNMVPDWDRSISNSFVATEEGV